MPARLPSSLRAIRYCPSGVQTGLRTYASFSDVSGRGFVPFASMSQTFSMPPRSLVKAIVRPSGENSACESQAGPDVIRIAAPPEIGSV